MHLKNGYLETTKNPTHVKLQNICIFWSLQQMSPPPPQKKKKNPKNPTPPLPKKTSPPSPKKHPPPPPKKKTEPKQNQKIERSGDGDVS